MMTTLKITRIFIDKVASVEIEKLATEESANDFGFCQRSITVWDEKGDKYVLILEAASSKNLELKEASDWLNPKVYKGEKEE